MIKEEEIEKIREYLNKSENPLFFYDDDPDGLASYLLLKKYIGKGTGIPIKSSPALDHIYLRKIQECSPDYVFILDKPFISQEFVDQVNVPIIWIDHHKPVDIKGVKYFNPRLHDDSDNRPTSYWCYQITKQDLWIAMVGIVGDWYLPEYLDEFLEQYPDLAKKTDDPGEMLFTTDFGKLVRIFWFLLKGSITDVKRNVSILSKIKTPYEILNKTSSKGRFVYKYFENINKNYESLLSEARKNATSSKLLLFIYPTARHSLTGYLSNQLLFTYPKKLIIIGREKQDKIVMSLRSKTLIIPPMLEKALDGIEGYGGGHDHACGGGVNRDDFPKFIENFKQQLKKLK